MLQEGMAANGVPVKIVNPVRGENVKEAVVGLYVERTVCFDEL